MLMPSIQRLMDQMMTGEENKYLCDILLPSLQLYVFIHFFCFKKINFMPFL